MGLKNAAQSFQRLVITVLEGLPNVFVYLDDTILFDQTKEEHIRSIENVFKRLEENGLTLYLKKCRFRLEEIDYLGYRVNRECITSLPRKLEAIANYPPPTKPKQLSGFLGAPAYYRRSLPKVKNLTAAEVLDPLYHAATAKKTGKEFTEVWAQDGLQKNFDLAKEMMMLAT